MASAEACRLSASALKPKRTFSDYSLLDLPHFHIIVLTARNGFSDSPLTTAHLRAIDAAESHPRTGSYFCPQHLHEAPEWLHAPN